MSKLHEKYMSMCFELALKAKGNVSPNPYVGSVIVKDEKVIAFGYHKKAGEAHAELDAILQAKSNFVDIKGATLYCNLEPCSHTNKRTPPCAQRIVSEGLSKVIICNIDPNPSVAGNGVKILEDAGIEVETGILEKEGLLLNEVFFTHITKNRPFIHLKWAQTLDGKIATTNGSSKWITSETSRTYAHKERELYDAIIVGSQTANKDNPHLTIRLNGQTQCKRRVVLTKSGNLDKDLNLFTDEFSDKTLIAYSGNVPAIENIKKINCQSHDHGLDLLDLLKKLYSEGIHSIYIEGGPAVISSFLKAKLYDRLSIYTAPKLLGKGIESVQSIEHELIKESIELETPHWSQKDKDMLLESQRNVCLQD